MPQCNSWGFLKGCMYKVGDILVNKNKNFIDGWKYQVICVVADIIVVKITMSSDLSDEYRFKYENLKDVLRVVSPLEQVLE